MKRVFSGLKTKLLRHKMIISLGVAMVAICCLLMILIFLIVNNIYRDTNIQREIEENDAIVEQISKEVRQGIYDINDASLSIYADKHINASVVELYENDGKDFLRELTLRQRISDELLIYHNMNEAVGCTQIYVENEEQPITVGDLTGWQVSGITKEYLTKHKDKVIEKGGELQVFSLEGNYIVYSRAFGEFNETQKPDEMIYSLVLVLSDNYMRKIMDKLYYSNYSAGKMICLVNEDERIVYSTNEEYIGHKLTEIGMEELKEGTGETMMKNEPVLYSAKYDENIKQYIMVSTEISAIDLYVHAFESSSLLVFLCIGLATVILLIVFVNLFVRPVQKLVNSVKRIGVDSHTVSMVDVGDGGDIALSLNEAITRLENMIDQNYQHIINEKNARIAILQLQINPHFIFNTLDSISWSIYKNDKEKSAMMIASLGKILRYTTYNYDKFVRLADEITIIKNYLYFEKIRHGEFREYFSVDSSLRDFRIPCLLIQPIVENACKHGLRDKDNARLLVRIRKLGDFAEIVIADNGKGMTKDEIESLFMSDRHIEGHIGIINVKERVEACFGKEAGFEISSEYGRYMKVRMLLPIKEV